MMRNIKLTLMYDGSKFHGYQLQPVLCTVEGELRAAAKRILGEEIKPVSCSRTDAGVHANMFCCNFRTESDRECEKLLHGLNAVLPKSVAVTGCEDVPESFHARYDCLGKEYIYKIWNAKERNPFLEKYALHYPFFLDCDFLNGQAKQFIGTHDFKAFCASGATVKTTVRTVFDCGVKRENDLVVFYVRGDGFLYNMVRIMAGTLLSISEGNIKKDSIGKIIESKDRSFAGVTAKADGLYLNKVFYPEVSPSGEQER